VVIAQVPTYAVRVFAPTKSDKVPIGPDRLTSSNGEWGCAPTSRNTVSSVRQL
jgi:hypothetical protein